MIHFYAHNRYNRNNDGGIPAHKNIGPYRLSLTILFKFNESPAKKQVFIIKGVRINSFKQLPFIHFFLNSTGEKSIQPLTGIEQESIKSANKKNFSHLFIILN